ncbi:MAG: hypothetical protein D6679_13540 [Candidatus Hydrogenedentota bacterium]|nr:MAG: hypothetical protein D6679_13540 [Candidatus Hydrogenedentota bacterium]
MLCYEERTVRSEDACPSRRRVLFAALAGLCAVLFLAFGGTGVEAREWRKGETLVTVVFRLELPPGTPASDTIYLAGNLPEVGEWSPAGVPAERTGPRTAEVHVKLPPGRRLEYKFTRGDWSRVEKDASFREIANRRLLIPQLSDPKSKRVLSVVVEAWSDFDTSRRKVESTLTGTIRFHRDFPSPELGNTRTVAVYLPPNYNSDTTRRYPVIYAHDGQNLFDAATSFAGVEWGIDEACEGLIASGEIPPVIVVGVYNTNHRMAEYTPVSDKRNGGGRGRLYERFLVYRLKPFIDSNYRTLPDREHTGLLGSSLGGLIALHQLFVDSKVFSRAAAVSTSFWWGGGWIFDYLESVPPPPQPTFLWLDMGTEEGDAPGESVFGLERAAEIVRKRGLIAPERLHVEVVEGASHNERFWSARIDRILKFLCRW